MEEKKELTLTYPSHTSQTPTYVAEAILGHMQDLGAGKITVRIPVSWGWEPTSPIDVIVKVLSKQKSCDYTKRVGHTFIRLEFNF